MTNVVAFVNSFLSYGALFCFIVFMCVISAFVGIKLRKNKDLKEGKV